MDKTNNAIRVLEDLAEKVEIKAHQRRTRGGKIVAVREHQDKRQPRHLPPAQAHDEGAKVVAGDPNAEAGAANSKDIDITKRST